MQRNTIIAISIVLFFIGAIVLGVVLGKDRDNVIVIDDTFPTLMEIGSTSCEPCQLLAPIIEEIKADYKGKVNVVIYDSWNTQAGAKKASEYGVVSIPTLIFLDKEGQEVSRMVGLQNYSAIVNELDSLGWK